MTQHNKIQADDDEILNHKGLGLILTQRGDMMSST